MPPHFSQSGLANPSNETLCCSDTRVRNSRDSRRALTDAAWDAEFVWVADAAGLPLVTADRKLARAFPGRVVSLEDLPLGS